MLKRAADQLGQRQRVGRGLDLTASGVGLLEHVRSMAEAASRVSLTASGQSQSVEGLDQGERQPFLLRQPIQLRHCFEPWGASLPCKEFMLSQEVCLRWPG